LNALNSILSFMQRDIALQAFAREGIAVWADESRTQFRNVIDIFDEVAARWQNMSDATREMFVQAADQAGLYSEEMAELAGIQKEFNDLQQRDISQAMAGIYRRNYLLALLQNWVKIDKVLISMEDSLGYSMKENERTMQTLQKQYESLKAAAQELAVAIGDTGLLNSLKEVVGGVKDVLNWFNELDPVAQRLIITFVEVTAALKILNAVFKMAGAGGAASLLSGWAVSATAAATSTRVLASAVTGLGTVMLNVGRGIAGFFGGPLGLALTAVGTAIWGLTSYMRQQEEQSRQNTDSMEKLSQQYDSLISKLETTRKGTAENANLQKQLQETMNAIADIMPQVVTEWDGYGNAIKLNNDLLRENIRLAKEAAAANYGKALSDAIKRQGELQRLIQEETDLQRDISFLADAPEGSYFAPHIPDVDKVKRYRTELEQIGKEVNRLSKLMAGGAADVGASLPGLRAISGGGEPSPGFVGPPPSDRKKTDAIKEQIKTLSDALDQFEILENKIEAALSRVGQQLTINASEHDYLTEKIKSGAATSEDYIRVQELTLVKTTLLQKEQDQLRQANAQYAEGIGMLTSALEKATQQYEAFKAAGDTEHMRDAQQVVTQLQGKINDLNNTISKNTSKLWENQRAIMETKRALSEDYFERLSAWVQHMASVGRLTAEQQLQYYKAIDKTTLSLQSQWRVEEQLYSLRRQSLQDEMEKISRAYDERMRQIEDEIAAEEEATKARVEEKENRIKAIDEETNAKIKAIQTLIDALDVEDEQSGREEAERQHNQKLADLQKQKQYHELRTGLEHAKAIDEINQQIAEEEHAWELKKQDWARQDQRKAYQGQIDALREQARARQDAIREEINDIKKASDTKKKELQRYYDDIQSLLNNKTIDLLAALAGTDEQWYQCGLEWMKQLARGIRDGQTELPQGAKDFVKGAEESKGKITPSSGTGPVKYKQPVATFSSSEYVNKDGRTYAQARLIAERLGLPISWDEKNWLVKIGGKGFGPDYIENDRAYLGLRRVGEDFGYDVRWDESSRLVSYLPKAHIGAYVARTGIAELLQGERVLSPRLTVSFDRLANVLANFPNIPDRISLMTRGGGYGSDVDRLADRIVAAIEQRKGIQINGNFVNIENVEDNADMESTMRQIGVLARQLGIAKGKR